MASEARLVDQRTRPVLVDQDMVAEQVPCQFLTRLRNLTSQTGPSDATGLFRIAQVAPLLQAQKVLLAVIRGDHERQKKEVVSRRLVG
jgi:hypothetical protein